MIANKKMVLNPDSKSHNHETKPLLSVIISSCFWVALMRIAINLAYAEESMGLPSISNDPTKAQQPSQLQQSVPLKRGEGFELPPVPKSGSLKQSGNTIAIVKVEFKGNTAISTEALNNIAAPYLKRQLYSADIEELRRKVTLSYIDKGFINSGALINNQSVASGTLLINIIEGKLTKINLSGQGRLRESYIRDRLYQQDEPLNTNKLQDKYRLLLGDRLIERLNGRLLQGSQLGEATLDVQVVRARPYQLYAGTDNYQTPAIGGYTGRMGGWVDNLLTLGERIDGQFIVNDGALGYNTGIDVPITPYGTRLGFRFSDTFTTIVEPQLKALNIKNNITGYEASLTQPVYRSFTDEVLMGLDFAVRQNKTSVDGQCTPFTEGLDTCDTQVSVLRLFQHLSHHGESNNLAFWSTFNVGLDVLGATKNQPGLQSGQFFSWLGQSIFSQRVMDNGAMVVLKGNIQLADSPLLNLERYSLGGVYTVRGYRENTYVRDNGFNVGVEFKYPLFTSYLADKGHFYLVPFMDYGGAWDNVTSSQSNQPTDYLHSVGIGFNWQYKQLSTDFYWGHAIATVNNPLKKSLAHDIQDDGIHFRVNMNAF